MKSLILYVAIITTLYSECLATTRNVPGNYLTIQMGLNACVSGDTVLVQPGTYIENIIWPSAVSNIKLLSSGGTNVTIISANGSGRVLSINSPAADTNTVISGFTISNGFITSGSGYGAGVFISNCSVLMQDLNVTGNRVFVPGGHGYGAGIHLTNSNSVIRNSRISENSTDSATWGYGGGVYISGGAPTFTDVTISNNTIRAENWCYGVGLYATNGAILNISESKITGNTSGNNASWYYGSGIYMNDVTANLTNVLIASNVSGTGGSWYYGSGIFMNDVTADLTNVLIASNVSGTGGNWYYGGGIYCEGNLGQVELMFCTITNNYNAGNGNINGSGLYASDVNVTVVNSILYNVNSGLEINTNGTGQISTTFSNVRGGATGTGNINVLPGFVSSNDFHLTVNSLCAGVASNTGPAIDLDGNSRPMPVATMPDMGCFEVDQTATGIADPVSANNFLNAYPNPVTSGEILFVEYAKDFLTITDVSGRIILNQKCNSELIQLETQNWESGVYFVHSNSNKSMKIILTK